MPKSCGTYSKPDARVKLIPVEEITYVQRRKPYCRRSITPPPDSRKVSLLPLPETAEYRDSLVGENIARPVSHQIALPKNPAPPSCKSSQPSRTYLNAGAFARDIDTIDTTEAFSSYYGSPIWRAQGGSSEWLDSLPKEAAIYSDSPSPKQAIAPQSNEDHVGTKAGPSSKSACSPESEELLRPTSVFRQQSTVVYLDRLRNPAPILRKHILPSPISLHHQLDAKAGAPSKSVCTPENGKSCSTSCDIATRSTVAPVVQSSTVESALLNPTPALGERSRELCVDGTRTAAAPIQHVLPSPKPLVTERFTDPNSKAGLKEAVVNHLSPSPKLVIAPCSSEDNLGTKAGPLSNSVCTPENELHTRSCNLATRTIAGPVLQSPVLESAPISSITLLGETSTEVYPDGKSTAVPTQQDPVGQHVLPSPTSMLSERSTEIHPNSSTGLCSSNNFLNKKIDLVSQQHKNTPRSHSLQSTAPAQCNASVSCDASSELRHKRVQETGAPVILHTKLHRKHYQSEAPWKGNFNVTGELKHACVGLEAQFPFQIFIRVYEAAKKMPEVLKLEAVALSQLWPKKFKMKPPDGQDIGLCFISSRQGPNRSFDHLLEKISSNIGLWTNIGDTELSVFSSKLLPPDYQRKDGKFYFWGVFGKRLRKNQHHQNNNITSMEYSNLSQPNEDSGDKSEDTVAKLHATEDRETESAQPENGVRVDERGGKEREMDKSKGTAASLLNGCCSHDTANKSTFNVADSHRPANINSSGSALMVDYPRGFSLKTDRVNDRAAMLGTPDSNPVSLLTGCCHDTANKSTFSVADLKLETPPGFSLKNDRVDECAVVLGTPDSNSAFNDAATASLLDGCCSHGSAKKSTSSLADFPCEPANIDLMLEKPNGCPVVLGTPSSEPASSCTAPVDSLLSRCFGRDWNKSTFSLSDSLLQPAGTSSVGPDPDLKLDTHPEFSLNVPPGFSKAHCRTEANDVPYVDAPPSLVMDTIDGLANNIPPGFTEAHRGLPRITSTESETGVSTPVTEKKPLVRFSLNVPRLVKTETLPGFTTPNAVKQEPGSPAVDKPAEKLTPYVDAPPSLVMDTTDGLTNNIPPGFTEAHRGLHRITSTESETGVSSPVTEKKPLIRFSLNVPRLVRTETLPGFITPNAAKQVPGSPAVDKATEKLMPSPLASCAPSARKAGTADGMRITGDEVTEDDETSEEREFPKIRRISELYGTPRSRSCTEVCTAEQPEKHRNQGGMQEPLADTAKRLKVNGRLALSNGVDRQTNQDQENGRGMPSVR